MSFKFLLSVFIVPVLIVVAYFDYKWRRIPNFITFSMIITGFILHIIVWGWSGFQSSLVGCLIGGGIFFILYWLGGMGAGDVKLVGGIGALLGADKIIPVILSACFIGGLMAIIKIIKSPSRVNVEMGHVVKKWFRKEKSITNNPEDVISRNETIPYGIAIVIGTIITLFLP